MSSTPVQAAEAHIPESEASVWLRPELIASWWEVFAVFFVVQSHYIYGAAKIFLRRLHGLPWTSRLNDYHAVHLLGGECSILAIFFVYLHWRGWRPADLKITVNRIGISQGIFLAFLVLLLTASGEYLVRILHIRSPFPHVTHFAYSDRTHLGWAALLAHLIVNALFEEVTCMAYAFNQFAAKRGPAIAILLVLLLRASYHIWKSPADLVITVAGFSLFGLFYWKTRNVWPLIVAHCVFDLYYEIPEVR